MARPKSTTTAPRGRGRPKAAAQQQKPLSFTSKITKPTSTPQTAASKAASVKAAALLSTTPPPEEEIAPPAPKAADVSDPTEDTPVATKEEVKPAALAIRQQSQSRSQEKRSEVEDKAMKVTEAQVKRYWREKEAARKAPRVHQQSLSIHEKILHEFDMSYQYGPSTGIPRLRRWKRAHKLNLSPPIEVLSVLLKEDPTAKDAATQRSIVDELMANRYEVAAV